MASVGELIVSIIGDISQIKKAFEDVSSQAGQMGKKFQETGKQMTSAGKTLSTYVTAPVLGLGAVAFHTASSFDDSMRKVKAISGATGDEFKQLTDLARELGRTTRFSASEAAEGMQYLAMAGFSTGEAMESIDDMLSLAAAGAIDLGTAADIASNVLTGFNLQASEAGRVADVLAKASASSNTDITQLGQAMSYVAPLAAAMGISMEETAAIIGKMSDAGVQGSRAGTALRGAMTRLADPTAEVAGVLEQYQLTLADVDPTTQSFTDIIERLSTVGLSTADAMALFGQEAGPGMIALLSTGSGAIREQTKLLENSAGAAAKMAEEMEGGPGGAIRELKSALQDVMITFGDVVAEGLMPLVSAFTKFLNLVSGIPKPILKVIVAVAAIAAAIGPIIIMAGSAIGAIGTITTFLGGAGLAGALGSIVAIITGPIGIAIAGLAVGAILIWKSWDKVSPIVRETLENIRTAIEPFIPLVKDFVSNAMNKITDWWTENGGTITSAIAVIVSALGTLVSYIADHVVDNVMIWLPLVLKTFEYVFEQVLNLILLFSQILTGDWEGAWQTLQNITQNSMDFLYSIISSALEPILNLFASAGSSFYQSGKDLIQNFINGIKSMVNPLTSTVSDAFSSISRYLPHSPAEVGPLSELPNWDAFFVSPLKKSVGKMDSMLTAGLGSIAGTFSTSNNTTNNTYAGDEFVIQNVNLSADYPFEKFVHDLEKYNRQKRIQRGYTS
ncbi:phage tail tape measure protein [Methanolobus halotolerans]|uniref:Phage tail tape measure protein n=1 Tax=Methanolobus halotolerans TaxID=2052935 RepID=A0A4E0QXR2_9EURY|nr:phage tail tape measure protein [Methanolobus halotolerans]TGC08131.1 phage tail tape measure protein [Methanolobus halotolerans]